MARDFKIPSFYNSSFISKLKETRDKTDHYKQDYSPSILDLGVVKLKVARHFGFCFGVKNAIEIIYQSLAENPNSKIYLLSEMIHNSYVNDDLKKRGVRFIQTSDGRSLISLKKLQSNDIVIIPAFGATVEMLAELKSRGIEIKKYNTTCPFVEKVWKKAYQLGKLGYTVIVHGQEEHEETKATFSHAKELGPALIIRNMDEAEKIALIMQNKISYDRFYEIFENRYTKNFDPKVDLKKIGIVNQTTILATETKEISFYLRSVVQELYPQADEFKEHFMDAHDTLCYSTAENQKATHSLIDNEGDLAIVIGGYNSSNTSHIVEILEKKISVYYIQSAEEIHNKNEIQHFDLQSKKIIRTKNWLPNKEKITILITAGASCPDVLVDEVILEISKLYQLEYRLKQVVATF